MPEDLSDQMPFSIELDWNNRKLELLIIPDWCAEELEMRFAVHLDQKEIGVIAHDNTLTDGWVWVDGDLDQERADLIGNQINNHYL